MALNTPRNKNRKCFTVSTAEPIRNYNDSKKIYKSANFSFFSKTECLLCRSKDHTKLLHCDTFKNHEMATRIRIVLDNGLCWRCLGPKHRAFQCTARDIDACSRWLYDKLVCNCNYSGKKLISGSLTVEK